MNCISPTFNHPALLSASSSLLEICELPEMVHGIEVANLNEPSSYTLHNLSSSSQSSAPVCLPVKQISRMESVRAQLKYTT